MSVFDLPSHFKSFIEASNGNDLLDYIDKYTDRTIVALGSFEIPDQIVLKDGTDIKVLGTIKLADHVNKHMIVNEDTTNGNKNFLIDGCGVGDLDGNRDEQTGDLDIFHIDGNAAADERALRGLRNIRVHHAKRYGVYTDSRITMLDNAYCYENGGGIKLDAEADDSFIGPLVKVTHGQDATIPDLIVRASNCDIHGYYGSSIHNNIDCQSCDKNKFWVRCDYATQHDFILHYGGFHEIHAIINSQVKDADNTYSQIYLSNSAAVQHCTISGVLKSPLAGNRPKYGVEEVGAADFNLFCNLNILAAGYQTAGVKKVGANSVANAATIVGSIV